MAISKMTNLSWVHSVILLNASTQTYKFPSSHRQRLGVFCLFVLVLGGKVRKSENFVIHTLKFKTIFLGSIHLILFACFICQVFLWIKQHEFITWARLKKKKKEPQRTKFYMHTHNMFPFWTHTGYRCRQFPWSQGVWLLDSLLNIQCSLLGMAKIHHSNTQKLRNTHTHVLQNYTPLTYMLLHIF